MKRTAYFITAAVIIVVAIPYIILTLFSAPEEETVPETENLNLQQLSDVSISVFLEDENQTVEFPLE